MNKNAILSCARKLIEANPDNLNDPDNYINHLAQVYDLTKEVVTNIVAKYPNIPLIEEEISMASGLHDIGRPLQKDQTFHELRGAEYIEKKGLKEGVASSLKDICRVAQMFRSHGFAYEQWNDAECVKNKKEFEPLETCLIVPRTWQEAIVTYSDLISRNGERVDGEDKLNEVLQRYSGDPRYQDETVIRTINLGYNRILELEERVNALEQGKLTEQDIVRYGFL